MSDRALPFLAIMLCVRHSFHFFPSTMFSVRASVFQLQLSPTISRHNVLRSPQLLVTTSSCHSFQLSQLPVVTASSCHNFQVSQLPVVTASSHSFQLSQFPVVTASSYSFQLFLTNNVRNRRSFSCYTLCAAFVADFSCFPPHLQVVISDNAPRCTSLAHFVKKPVSTTDESR